MSNATPVESKQVPLSRRLRRSLRILVALVGVVIVWRGIWNLMDGYFFPDQPLVSNLGSLALGLALLWFDDFKFDELT